MKVRAFTYEMYHGKGQIGSTRLRVHQLIKYWPEYGLYKYGELPDVMVYQKVYIQDDWKLMEHLPSIQILDICDPDWFERQMVKQTIDCMDGVVCPTEPMAEFLRQMTDKPVLVIPDRHDLELIPPRQKHTGVLTNAVWFGYKQNADCLKGVVPVLERMDIRLTVISNDDPFMQRYAKDPNAYDRLYTFQKFDPETIAEDLGRYQICILPKGNEPKDRFKSNNKTTLAQLCGLPVVTDIEGLEAMQTAEARDKEVEKMYNKAREFYDVRISVGEMKDFIKELQDESRN